MASHINKTAILLHAKETCTLPDILHEALPIINDWTFHRIISAVALTTTALTLITSFSSIYRHLANYTAPSEQRHMVRILLTPFIFGLFNFLAIWFYEAASYLQPVADLYEVFAVIAIFQLFLAFVCPNPDDFDAYFVGLERRSNRKQTKKHDRGSLRWFYYIWVAVFQVLPTRLICLIIGWVIHAVMCPLDPNLGYANIAVTVIGSVFTAISLLAILRFYRRLREPLRQRHSLSKLVMFKLIIGISLTQGPILAGLSEGGVLKPTEYISYQDWSIGLNALCICSEMFVFSIMFMWPFTAKPYTYREPNPETGRKRQAGLGLFAALWDVVNVWDVVSGAFFHNKLVKVCRPETTVLDKREYDQLPVLAVHQMEMASTQTSRSGDESGRRI